MDLIYLDNNATTRPLPGVAAAVAEANESLWANPSSVHRFGQTVRQQMELARASTAKLIGAKPRELVLTSGGTEANNLAIGGTLRDELSAATLMTTKTEHAAVREVIEAVEKRGGRVVWLPLREGGVVDLSALAGALAQAAAVSQVVMLSVMWANNETGVVQPISEIAAAVAEVREAARQAGRAVKIVFHTDATQAVGKLPVDVKGLGDACGGGVDLLTLAAHKFHGPKGVGALWLRRGVRVRPQQLGGPQETQRRGGTENVPAVIGMGVASDAAAEFVNDTAEIARLSGLRDRLEERVRAGLADGVEMSINSGCRERLWNTTNLGFRRLEAEAILLGLSERGVCASAGAACSSGSLEPSPVLRAMGVEEAVAHGSIRLSLSRFTTRAEIDRGADVVVEVVKRLSRVMPTGRV